MTRSLSLVLFGICLGFLPFYLELSRELGIFYSFIVVGITLTTVGIVQLMHVRGE